MGGAIAGRLTAKLNRLWNGAKVNYGQVVLDAFGNALGSAFNRSAAAAENADPSEQLAERMERQTEAQYALFEEYSERVLEEKDAVDRAQKEAILDQQIARENEILYQEEVVVRGNPTDSIQAKLATHAINLQIAKTSSQVTDYAIESGIA